MIGIGSESNTPAPLAGQPELPICHRVFSKNLEEGNQAFKGLFDYEQFQLASGEFNSELLSLAACESILGSFRYFAAAFNQGALRADQVGIGLPALDSQCLWWGHAHGSRSTFEIPTLIPGEMLHQKTQSGPPVLAVFIERSKLEAAAEAMGLREHIDDVFRPNRTSRWLACCPEKTAHVRHELGEILRRGLAGSSELRADEVQAIILSEILELLDDRIHPRNPPSRADAALVERAGATFDANLELRSVSALALTLGVPRRTLKLYPVCTGKYVAIVSSEELAILDRMTLVDNDGDGQSETVRFTQVNVQIVNGRGSTDTINGRGNLIVGYDEDNRPPPSDQRSPKSGSHNVVFGVDNFYSSFAGLIGGTSNDITEEFAVVLTGAGNRASGLMSSITAGSGNLAAGEFSSVVGGTDNSASRLGSSVGGGRKNRASAKYAAVNGGLNNIAAGENAAVNGGELNRADGENSSANGGDGNRAEGLYSSANGGEGNVARGRNSTVNGGFINQANGAYSSANGGRENDASGTLATVSGGTKNQAAGYGSTVSGSTAHLCSGVDELCP
ncbi:MAG: hypothetical protein P8K76_15535 [Candidatus Binatia bacterium]|nr:hypothetical protein [Candidatus Binatia bacterium]MDG2011178.1 hypothetical protein [Candidatus Binatia bacterium]